MFCPATSKNCESTGCTINRCALQINSSTPPNLPEGQAHDTFLKDIAEQKYPFKQDVTFNALKQKCFIEGMQHIIANPKIFHLCNKTKEEGIIGEDKLKGKAECIYPYVLRPAEQGLYTDNEVTELEREAYKRGYREANTHPKKEEGEDIRKENKVLSSVIEDLDRIAYNLGKSDRPASQRQIELQVLRLKSLSTLPSTTENKSTWSCSKGNDCGCSKHDKFCFITDLGNASCQFYQKNKKEGIDKEEETAKVSRVEVIDENGRSYTKYFDGKCELSYQDHRRTLKIFITPKPEEKNTSVTEGKEEHYVPDFIKKEMAENKTPEKIREWINEFLSELPEAFREKVDISAESCFPIHVMHEGRKDIEYDTLCQRMNFIQGVLATYKYNLLATLSEPSSIPVVDYEKEGLDLYPVTMVMCSPSESNNNMGGMCDINYYIRQAHIRARQMSEVTIEGYRSAGYKMADDADKEIDELKYQMSSPSDQINLLKDLVTEINKAATWYLEHSRHNSDEALQSILNKIKPFICQLNNRIEN